MDQPAARRGSRRLFGRDEDLDRLVRLLEPGAPAFVTLTGRGGVGKTALALEVMRTLDREPSTLVALAGVTEPELVVSEIATALSLQVEAGESLIEAVAAVLRHGSHLLVLDNAEHLLSAAPAIADLIRRCDALRVLVTSQAPLQLDDEQVVTLSPLPVPVDPASMSSDELARQPAVAVYCQRSASVDQRFELTAGNAPAVAELCRRLEGLPLAIELAAARAATLPACEILRRVDGGGGLGLLRRERRDVPERHRGLEEAIDWTYRLLTADEQRALRRLAALIGTIDIDTAVAVLHPEGGDAAQARALDELAALVDLHLVDPVSDTDPPRFSLPESIRSFARAELVDLGELAEVEQLRLAVRAEQSRAVAAGTESGIEQRLIVQVEADRDDLLDALRSATTLGRADDALDIARGLGDLWDLRGYGPTQEELLDRAIELGERDAAGTSRLANAMLWSGYLGLRHSSAVDQEELVARIGRAERMAQDAGDDAALFHAQCIWMLVSPVTGDFDRAQLASELGLRLADEASNEGWRAVMEVWAGMLAGLLGDADGAVRLGAEALRNARRSGDQETVVRAAVLLGAFPDVLAQAGADLPSAEEALALSRELGLTYYEAILLVRLVERSLRLGERESAVHWLSQALDTARLLVGSQLVSLSLLATAGTAHLCGDADGAAYFYGTMSDQFDFLLGFMSESQQVRHQERIDAVRSELGATRFEAQARLGSALTHAQAVEEAISYVAELGEPVLLPSEPAASTRQQPIDRLTNRQLEVLRLIAAGMSNKDIAAELGVRVKTVMHHTTAIYRELGVRGRGEAAALAFRLQLVE